MAYAESIKTDRGKMMEFARYMESRWPKENAADLARHQIAILLIRDQAARFKVADDSLKALVADNVPDPVLAKLTSLKDKEFDKEQFLTELGKVLDKKQREKFQAVILTRTESDRRVKNLQDAMRSLNQVTPAYPGFAMAKFLLAVKAMEADKDKVPPLVEPGKPPLSWHQLAMSALEVIQDPMSGDPTANEIFARAKVVLGNEMYKEKKFEQMEQLAVPLLPKLASLKFSDDPTKDRQLHDDFLKQLTFLRLFGQYGKADAAFTANDFAKVSTILDPLVTEVKASKDHLLKTNQPLAQAMLSMALRSRSSPAKWSKPRRPSPL